MPRPSVSVVVPTRGGADRLPVLLHALASQALDEPWEAVFVLDGDVDGSRALIEAYADRLPLRIVSPDGTGVGAALAAGYEAASGEIVVRCDDDLTPGPGFLAGHLARHRARPDGSAPLGVVSLTRDVFTDSAYAAAYGRPANERLIAQAYARPAAERWRHWAACNSVPKAAYDAAGGFDPSMSYREDSELGLRLARSGVEIVIDPDLEVEHRGPAPDTATRAGRAFTSGASTVAFDERHPGAHGTSSAPTGPWGRAVALAASRIGSRDEATALGRRIDTLLPRLPRRARGKAVAWAVEASALAGHRVGDTTWVRDAPVAEPSTVSVVVPHYGDPAPTLALLDQLAAQTHPVQVVVADDASPTPFPDREGVEVVRRPVNGGFGANVNSGAAAATGDAMLVLNSDLTIEPTFVADMVAAARSRPGAVLAPRMVDEHGTEAWVGRDVPRVRHQVAAWLTPLARFRGTSAWHRAVGHDVRAHGAEADVDWVVGAAMWIPVAEFRAVGGFDERFFMNSEEVDLQRRLRERGVRVVALRSPTVVHAGGGSSPSESRRRWLVEGQLAYADKWGSRRGLQAALAAATGANFVVNAARRATGREVHPVETARTELSLIRGRR
ncbi:glycosyltransferase [Nocardioides sp.]|uniref:glycosyltransferase family 2 protein n=1 Tax=Nocardioides sp. TaxID=35761 RepID=UPI002615D948|nr:glycosyltransferase [Nocardioides sp.]MCW2738256.1 hypothetical protein [Nocardioides sp.]